MILGLALAAWLHRHHRPGLPVPSAPPDPGGPLISVVVPARNEARNIRRCVAALLAQTHPRLEVLVVDDRSTDATPRILAELAAQDGEARLRMIPGAPLPEGWAGKPHALMQGADMARGEWLCFVDADTFAGPDLLASTYAAACAHSADLLSVLTLQELRTFWEKAVMPIVFTGIALSFSPERVNDPRRPEAIANGQFILIRRAAYEAVGGHRALRGSLVEDKDLAERVKRAGYRLILADGRALARTRMYTSFKEIWEGWTKNIYFGLRDKLWLLPFGAFMSAAGALFLPGWLLGSLTWLLAGGGWPALVMLAEAALLGAYVLFTRAEVAREFGISRAYALTLPLGALVVGAMMLASAFKVWSGRGVT
ncbi:MAG: glycosyltransferase, partial [Anaerolineales bacterium]